MMDDYTPFYANPENYQATDYNYYLPEEDISMTYDEFVTFFDQKSDVIFREAEYRARELDTFINPNLLLEATKKCMKGVSWKPSVQHFWLSYLYNIFGLYDELYRGTYKTSKFNEFELKERGHTRLIKAQQIRDRVVQTSFDKNVLFPKIMGKLIYDNGASIKNKGVSFTRKRFEMHLREAYKEYGPNAYVVLLDVRKFFDNLQHPVILEMFRPYLSEGEFKFLAQIISDYEIDVSYMSEEEFGNCMNEIFNSLDYNSNRASYNLDGSKMMQKSMGIGCPTSQITGIYYSHTVDNYFKIVRSIKYYDRYMDDVGIVVPDKQTAHQIVDEAEYQYSLLGLQLNRSKTQIIPITSWIPFLKINYKLTPTGGLIRKVNSETIRREFRRVNKFKHLVDTNYVDLDSVLSWYRSWRGSYIDYDSKSEIYQLDRHIINLFGLQQSYSF